MAPTPCAAGPSHAREVWCGHQEPAEREQFVMSMYYEHDMNLKEIAAVLKVTESRVCQLHSQSIARLRVKLRTGEGRAPQA